LNRRLRSSDVAILLLLSGILLFVPTQASAQDTWAVWPSQSIYQVGDLVVIHFTIPGDPSLGGASLAVSGPSGQFTYDVGPAGPGVRSLELGIAEPEDIGHWTVSLSTVCAPGVFCFMNPISTEFWVEGERVTTVTETVTVWVTSTRTETQRSERTITVTRTTATVLHTVEVEGVMTVTARLVTATQALTGLFTSTVYSPTITSTIVASAQIISNPLLWMTLSTFAMIGAVIQLPRSGRLRAFHRELAAVVPISEALAWLARRQVRRALFSICLLSVVTLSIAVGQEAHADTVTTTRTVTSTEWVTVTERVTSTRYVTHTATTMSELTLTRMQSARTIIPMTTTTVDHRSWTTVYLPTTVTLTSTARTGYGITGISRVYYDPFRREIIDVTGTVVKNGTIFEIQLTLENLREGFYQVKVYREPYFTPETLAYGDRIWPDQILSPVEVQTPELSGGSQICIDVELDVVIEAVLFVVDMVLPVPVDVVSYAEHIVWLASELVSHMTLQGYLRSDYATKPDAIHFLSKFSDLCANEPKYVLALLSEFAKRCYITVKMEGLENAIEDFASKWLLPFKLLLWDIHVWQTPATEIVYVDIGETSASGAG